MHSFVLICALVGIETATLTHWDYALTNWAAQPEPSWRTYIATFRDSLLPSNSSVRKQSPYSGLLDEAVIYLLLHKKTLRCPSTLSVGDSWCCEKLHLWRICFGFTLDMKKNPHFLLSNIAYIVKVTFPCISWVSWALTLCLSHHPPSTREKKAALQSHESERII